MNENLIIFYENHSCAVKSAKHKPIFYSNNPYNVYFMENILNKHKNSIVINLKKSEFKNILSSQQRLLSRCEFSILENFEELYPLFTIEPIHEIIYSTLRDFYLFKNQFRPRIQFHLLSEGDSSELKIFREFFLQLQENYKISDWKIDLNLTKTGQQFLASEKIINDLLEYFQNDKNSIHIVLTNSCHIYPYFRNIYTIFLEYCIDKKYFKTFQEIFSIKRQKIRKEEKTVILKKTCIDSQTIISFDQISDFRFNQIKEFIALIWVWLFSQEHHDPFSEYSFLKYVLLQKLFPIRFQTTSLYKSQE